jgi:hypothetical protein
MACTDDYMPIIAFVNMFFEEDKTTSFQASPAPYFLRRVKRFLPAAGASARSFIASS